MQMRDRDNEKLVSLNQIDNAVWKLTDAMLAQLCIHLAPCHGKISEKVKCSSDFQQELGTKARNLRFVIMDRLT